MLAAHAAHNAHIAPTHTPHIHAAHARRAHTTRLPPTLRAAPATHTTRRAAPRLGVLGVLGVLGAAQLFTLLGLRHVAVIDYREHVIGIITRKDLLPHVLERFTRSTANVTSRDLLSGLQPYYPQPAKSNGSGGESGCESSGEIGGGSGSATSSMEKSSSWTSEGAAERASRSVRLSVDNDSPRAIALAAAERRSMTRAGAREPRAPAPAATPITGVGNPPGSGKSVRLGSVKV